MNLKYLVVGLSFTLPLVYFMGRGFDFNPNKIDSPLIGKAAPDFRLTTLGGGEAGLADIKGGKPAVVNFWATWCVPCRQEHPLLQKAAQRYGEKVQFYGIVYQDTEDKIRDWLGPAGSVYPTLVDMGSRTAIAYGVYGVPETFFVDRNGVVLDKYAGPLPSAYLIGMIEKLLGAS